MEPDTGFSLLFDDAIAFLPCLDSCLFSGIGLFKEPSLLADDLFKVLVVIIAVELIGAVSADDSDLVACPRHSDAMVALCFLPYHLKVFCALMRLRPRRVQAWPRTARSVTSSSILLIWDII